MNVGMNLISSMNAVKPQMAGMMNAVNNAKMKSDDHGPHMEEETHLTASKLAASNCCKLA